VSQLDLALAAQVSQRHISFLETGRASPTREMVVRLARALDIPLRERNALLATAGFAPLYGERSLESPDLDHLRHVLEVIVEAHEPSPAYVVDRTDRARERRCRAAHRPLPPP
jgi:transcriptional regulator with XRE-family HTH domain